MLTKGSKVIYRVSIGSLKSRHNMMSGKRKVGGNHVRRLMVSDLAVIADLENGVRLMANRILSIADKKALSNEILGIADKCLLKGKERKEGKL